MPQTTQPTSTFPINAHYHSCKGWLVSSDFSQCPSCFGVCIDSLCPRRSLVFTVCSANFWRLLISKGSAFPGSHPPSPNQSVCCQSSLPPESLYKTQSREQGLRAAAFMHQRDLHIPVPGDHTYLAVFKAAFDGCVSLTPCFRGL